MTNIHVQISATFFTIIENAARSTSLRKLRLGGKTVVAYIGDGVSNTARCGYSPAGKLI